MPATSSTSTSVSAVSLTWEPAEERLSWRTARASLRISAASSSSATRALSIHSAFFTACASQVVPLKRNATAPSAVAASVLTNAPSNSRKAS